MTEPTESLPPIRDPLAYERTTLANERTLLAYIRTALAFLATGLGILNFATPTPAGNLFAWALLAVAAVILALGIRSFLLSHKRTEYHARTPER